MRELPRRLKAEAEALGLSNVHFEWNHDRPRIVGEFVGVTVVQPFSFTRSDWHRAHRNAVASLRRKVQALIPSPPCGTLRPKHKRRSA